MRLPTPILRTTYHWPAAVFSVLFTITLTAAFVPVPLVQALLLLGYAGVVVIVALGGLEELAVALLTGSTRLRPQERPLLTPVVVQLDGPRADLDRFRVRRTDSADPAVALGRAPWLVVSPSLLRGLAQSHLSAQEAAALITHAEGRRQVTGRTHLAWLLTSAPWRGLAHLVRGLGRTLSWIPFGAISWRCRGLLAPICLIQSITGGRTLIGVGAATIIVLSYAIPAAERAIEQRSLVAADHAVAASGLGAPLARLLRRTGEPVSPDRLDVLLPAVPGTAAAQPAPAHHEEAGPTRPHLRLVRS